MPKTKCLNCGKKTTNADGYCSQTCRTNSLINDYYEKGKMVVADNSFKSQGSPISVIDSGKAKWWTKKKIIIFAVFGTLILIFACIGGILGGLWDQIFNPPAFNLNCSDPMNRNILVCSAANDDQTKFFKNDFNLDYLTYQSNLKTSLSDIIKTWAAEDSQTYNSLNKADDSPDQDVNTYGLKNVKSVIIDKAYGDSGTDLDIWSDNLIKNGEINLTVDLTYKFKDKSTLSFTGEKVHGKVVADYYQQRLLGDIWINQLHQTVSDMNQTISDDFLTQLDNGIDQYNKKTGIDKLESLGKLTRNFSIVKPEGNPTYYDLFKEQTDIKSTATLPEITLKSKSTENNLSQSNIVLTNWNVKLGSYVSDAVQDVLDGFQETDENDTDIRISPNLLNIYQLDNDKKTQVEGGSRGTWYYWLMLQPDKNGKTNFDKVKDKLTLNLTNKLANSLKLSQNEININSINFNFCLKSHYSDHELGSYSGWQELNKDFNPRLVDWDYADSKVGEKKGKFSLGSTSVAAKIEKVNLTIGSVIQRQIYSLSNWYAVNTYNITNTLTDDEKNTYVYPGNAEFQIHDDTPASKINDTWYQICANGGQKELATYEGGDFNEYNQAALIMFIEPKSGTAFPSTLSETSEIAYTHDKAQFGTQPPKDPAWKYSFRKNNLLVTRPIAEIGVSKLPTDHHLKWTFSFKNLLSSTDLNITFLITRTGVLS